MNLDSNNVQISTVSGIGGTQPYFRVPSLCDFNYNRAVHCMWDSVETQVQYYI